MFPCLRRYHCFLYWSLLINHIIHERVVTVTCTDTFPLHHFLTSCALHIYRTAVWWGTVLTSTFSFPVCRRKVRLSPDEIRVWPFCVLWADSERGKIIKWVHRREQPAFNEIACNENLKGTKPRRPRRGYYKTKRLDRFISANDAGERLVYIPKWQSLCTLCRYNPSVEHNWSRYNNFQ